MAELAAVFNPFEIGYQDDPYEQFGRIRATNPVHRSVLGAWMLFSYADVAALLRDPTASVDPMKAAPTDGAFGAPGPGNLPEGMQP